MPGEKPKAGPQRSGWLKKSSALSSEAALIVDPSSRIRQSVLARSARFPLERAAPLLDGCLAESIASRLHSCGATVALAQEVETEGGCMSTGVLFGQIALSPHGRSLRVALCPPRGPLRLRPGKAGSAAPAGWEGISAPFTWLLSALAPAPRQSPPPSARLRPSPASAAPRPGPARP